MRATLIYGAGDVRVEDVPDAALREPTDAVVRVLRSCICGSDLRLFASHERSAAYAVRILFLGAMLGFWF
jgi:threonine dehydrogenase-like Zn-dependent dehydrogenase